MKFSVQQKQQHVANWRQSSLTQSVYCQRHGINPNSFKNWPYRYAVQAYSCLPVTITPTVDDSKEIILEHPCGIRLTIPGNQLTSMLQTLLSC